MRTLKKSRVEAVENDKVKPLKDDIGLKVFMTLLLLSFINFVLLELSNLIYNNNIRYIINGVIVPSLNIILFMGMYVSIIEYFLDINNFFITSIFNIFNHKKRVIITFQMFNIFLIKVLFTLIAFAPIFTLFLEAREQAVNNYFGILVLLDRYFIKTFIYTIYGLFAFNFLNDLLIEFYFNFYYNTLSNNKKYNSFIWNLKGSIKNLFSNKKTITKLLLTNIYYSILTIITIWLIMEFSLKFTLGADVITNLKILAIFRTILIIIMIFIESSRTINVSKTIAQNID